MSLDVTAGGAFCRGAFVAGLLSLASPRVLPFVPACLAYVGGVSAGELRDGESDRVRRRRLGDRSGGQRPSGPQRKARETFPALGTIG